MSLRAYGRRRGVTLRAVQRAIASNRLLACLVFDARGRTQIGDPNVADAEWACNSNYARRPDLESPLPVSQVTSRPRFTTHVCRDGNRVVLSVRVNSSDLDDEGWHNESMTREAARALSAQLLEKANQRWSDVD